LLMVMESYGGVVVLGRLLESNQCHSRTFWRLACND
jgi:hypothetical protein